MKTTVLMLTLMFSCSPPAGQPDAGTGGGSAGGGDMGGQAVFRPFTPPGPTMSRGGFLVAISAEASATEGFPFPPTGMDGLFFVDGWELRYQHLITTVDTIELSENPDMNPSDPAMTGPAVARGVGPWAVDLAKNGPLRGKEMQGTAVPLVRLANQNLISGTPAFSNTARYALSFDTVEAHASPFNVNLDETAMAAYQVMRRQGWSYWIQGTATYRGAMSSPACRTSAAYDASRIPRVVHFSFGWKAAASHKNCKNQELTPLDSRGVQLSSGGGETVVQLTLHNDHPFWDALEEDAPLRFDAIAARKSVPAGMTATEASVSTDDLRGVDFEALTDAQGIRLPFRYCGPVRPGERTSGGLFYDPKGVAVHPLGGMNGLKDLYEYMAYNLSTAGHLNAGEGLCVVQRKYPSPP